MILKARQFTLIETVAAFVILAIIAEIICSFIVNSNRITQYSQSSQAVSLTMESTLNRLQPQNYTIEDLQAALEREGKFNSLKKRGISWQVDQKENKAIVLFKSSSRILYQAELSLP